MAAILVVAVLAVGVVVALATRNGGGIPTAAPSPSIGQAPTSPGAPSASPSAPSAPAHALLEIVDQLLALRAGLEAEVAKSRTDAVAIADLLRDVNASLLLQAAPLADLAADPGTSDLATRIRTMNEATFEAVRRTQRASITNAKAYRAGAAEVIQALDPLPGLRAELALVGGGSPAPASGPSQTGAAPTSSPSGVTP